MQYLLLLVPMPPLAAFLMLALDPARLDRRAVIAMSVAAGVLPAILLGALVIACFSGACTALVAPIFTLVVGEAEVALAVGLDPLSAVAGVTVTVVGAAVLVYSVDYMADASTADLRRFFALMNLFLAGMLAVVLAADSVSLFLGWELMGLCSFFLIAYYVTEPRAVAAGRKAFVITRIADAALLAGLLLLFLEAGTIRLDTLIPTGAAMEGPRRALIAALLLVGALGKSAQLPFQTWLPTAMAGPTPVSALLHSATMVAAGAFLLARFAPVFATTPGVSAAMAVFGVATAAFGATCAVAQTDTKRLLAYSSISQIGLMVLAVGVGAPEVAVAHFVVHAAFKSLLFMAAAAMAHAAHGDTAIAALAGARKRTPVAFWTFAAGAASLAGLPIVTAGWWSKEAVLSAAFSDGVFGILLWALAVAAAVLTGAYAFRPVFTAALDRDDLPEPHVPPHHDTGDEASHEGPATVVPLVFLAVLSLAGGLLVEPIVRFLGGHPEHPLLFTEIVGASAAILGIVLAYAFTVSERLSTAIFHARHLRAGLRMDARYHVLLVRPYRRLVARVTGAEANRPEEPAGRPTHPYGRLVARLTGATGPVPDPVGTLFVMAAVRLKNAVVAPFLPDRLDRLFMGSAGLAGALSARARRLQTGRVRDYALALAAGAVLLLLTAWVAAWR